MMKFRFEASLGDYPERWTRKRILAELPCCQAVAGEDLPRGAKVVIRKIDEDEHPVAFMPTSNESYTGIVDPFLYDTIIDKGTVFWLLMHPDMAVDARAEWTCPAIDWLLGDKPKEYLTQLAEKMGMTYAALIEVARNYLYHNEYYVDRTKQFKILNTFVANVDLRRFWLSVQAVTGMKLPDRLESVPIVTSYDEVCLKANK